MDVGVDADDDSQGTTCGTKTDDTAWCWGKLSTNSGNSPQRASRGGCSVPYRDGGPSSAQTSEDAAGVKATGLEVLDTAEHHRRTEQPTVPPLVGFAEIAEMAGVSRQRAWQLADLTGFPPAVVETQSGPPRVRTQVEGWLSRWERKAGRPKRDTTTGADLGG
jgi:hypothetical protein